MRREINLYRPTFVELRDALREPGEPNSEHVTIHVHGGQIELTETLTITRSVSLIGRDGATLFARDGLNDHMIKIFSGDAKEKVTGIRIGGFVFLGNGAKQVRPNDARGVSFSHGIYMVDAVDVGISNIHMTDIRQTGVHCIRSEKVRIREFSGDTFGWSGLSTSGTHDYRAVKVVIRKAGLDTNHSGIHLDGGSHVVVEARVESCTGNAIMLDSTFCELSSFAVRGIGSNSRRGCSLSGFGDRPIRLGHISGEYCNNVETGIMVSNSTNIVLTNIKACNNGLYGILFQGRVGGTNCIVEDATTFGNPTGIAEIHASKNNLIWAELVQDEE